MILSSPVVPFTVTRSAAPSPLWLPGPALRSMATCVIPVPVRSLTVMLSAPPAGNDLHVLDAIEVHDDSTDVTGQ